MPRFLTASQRTWTCGHDDIFSIARAFSLSMLKSVSSAAGTYYSQTDGSRVKCVQLAGKAIWSEEEGVMLEERE